MKSKLITTLCLSSCGLLFGPLAPAQYCGLTNASLTGSYEFVASEGGAAATTTTTGTTTTGTTTTATTNGYSDTYLGELLGGIASGNQFAYSGVLVFDGAGNIRSLSSLLGPSSAAASAASATTFSALQFTGTYTANADCAGTMTISSASGTTTGTTTGTIGAANETLTINFVVMPPSQSSQYAQAPGLTLSFSSTNETGSGYALAQ